MGSLGEAVLDLTADPSKMDRGLEEGKGKVTGALSGLKGAFGDATGTMLGQLSAGMLNQIGAGIISVGKDITGAALSAEQAQAQLNAVIESTGGVAGVTADQVNDLADAYSQLTLFDDEAIIAGESLLLTFTNIGEEVFPLATETMLDMSQALGQDLTTSAMQLGKALNDPVQGVTALRRVGVQFTDDQEALIKTLVESGQTMEAQKMILAELQREFGGSAEAAGQTMAGQLVILNNEFDNVKEELGTAFLPVLKDLVGIAKELMPYLRQAVQWFGSLPTPVKTGAAGLLAFLAVLGPLIGTISSVVSLLSVMGPVLSALGAFFLTPVGAILLLGAAIVGVYLMFKYNVGGITTTAQQLWFIIKYYFGQMVTSIGTTLSQLGTIIKFYFMQAVTWVVTQVTSFVQNVRTAWQNLSTMLQMIWQTAWAAVQALIATKVGEIVAKAKDIVEGVKRAFDIDWVQLGDGIIDGILQGLRNGWDAVVQMAWDVAMAALNAAKRALGINSPSTAFAEIGQFSGLGFMQGFSGTLTPQAVSGTLARVVGGTGQAMSRTSNTSVNIYNPTPEPASRSLDNTMKKLSYLGVLK